MQHNVAGLAGVMAAVGLAVPLGGGTLPAAAPASASRPVIRKLGTLDCDMVETTPIVFHKRLYRVEYVRERYTRKAPGETSSYFRVVDVATGAPLPSFARGYHLCSAYVEDETVHVFGVEKWGANKVQGFRSQDLRNWETFPALDLPGWSIFNNSVCKGDGQYVMAIEIDAPPAEAGVPFTIRFAESKDLRHWKLTPSSCVYAKDRYTSCPTLRFLDGWFYLMYCEALPGPEYPTYLVRSTNLVQWESSPLNPVMKRSSEDHQVAAVTKGLTAADQERIAQGVNVCNSDIDFCEFEGHVVLYYCWGNQTGIEHLAEARCDGTVRQLLQGFFPPKPANATGR